MVAVTPEQVAHLARLARLKLEPDEVEHYASQLDVILAAVAEVSDVTTDGVPPTSHPLPLVNVMRPDVVRECLSRQEALDGAPAEEDGRFRVPRILGEEV